jgi:glucose/arabinose dehydrogenase
MIKSISPFLLISILTTSAWSQTLPDGFTLTSVNASLDDYAVGFAILPDGRILVVNQFSGNVDIIVNGVLTLDIFTMPDLGEGSEKGLLGIAIDPDFPESPYVYLFHSHNSNTNRVSRYPLSGDLTDPSSNDLTFGEQDLLVDDMPANATNHNGGTLRFGSDKTLHISHGDDANSSLVQNLATLNGKILRINRDGSIPDDNPFFDTEGARQEIFALGLRNPFRFSLDPETDDLIIGDVGQNSREEVSVSTAGGENFGWPRFEGTATYNENVDLLAGTTHTPPVYDYPQVLPSHSVISVAAYRQKNYPSDASFPPQYDGAYFFADFYDDWLQYLVPDGVGGWSSNDFGTGFDNIVDGALGADGSIYLLEFGSRIVKIEYAQPVPVELVSFSARTSGSSVVLTWRTVSETNNYGFQIERSDNGAPFEQLAFMPGHGSTTEAKQYVYQDKLPVAGRGAYRLRQIDLDGAFEFSEEVEIAFIAPEDFRLEQNFPNPANPTTTMAFQIPEMGEAHHTRLEIFDITGRKIRTLLNGARSAGTYQLDWDGRDEHGKEVGSGIYLYRLRYGNLNQSRKLLLVR